jgi:N-acetylglutamate synthase-like GNAT family acetyltransferase
VLKQVVVNRQKEGEERSRRKDSLLERVTAAAEERQLSHNSLIAYRRTWFKIIGWAAAAVSTFVWRQRAA